MKAALVWAVLALAACRTPTHAPLPTVAQVEVARYMGTWYEIAHLPNRFQADCVADTQAHYAFADDRVQVTNRCRTASGEFKQARGIAKIVPDSGNAKLRVSFFRPFYGDYWILALDPDYQWVLVGDPDRRYAWVLSRSKQLDAAALEQLLQRAASLGFDRQAFKRTPQG